MCNSVTLLFVQLESEVKYRFSYRQGLIWSIIITLGAVTTDMLKETCYDGKACKIFLIRPLFNYHINKPSRLCFRFIDRTSCGGCREGKALRTAAEIWHLVDTGSQWAH